VVARKVIQARAKWSIARSFATFFFQRISKRRNRLSQKCAPRWSPQTSGQNLPLAAGPQHVENGGRGLAIIPPGMAWLLLRAPHSRLFG